MNGSTALLPVAASSLGLSEDVLNKFRYSTAGFSVLGPQVDLVADPVREHGRRHLAVVAGSVEPAVNNALDASPERLEQHGIDDGVVGAAREQGLENREVHAMAAAIGAVGAEQRQAGEREVADRIEKLVADELVPIAQALGVHDAIVADGDGSGATPQATASIAVNGAAQALPPQRYEMRGSSQP